MIKKTISRKDGTPQDREYLWFALLLLIVLVTVAGH